MSAELMARMLREVPGVDYLKEETAFGPQVITRVRELAGDSLHALAFGHSRYHLPLMPLLLVYTAAALTNLGAIWRQRRSLRFVAVSAVCAALVAGWAWTFIAVDLARLTGAA